MLYVMKLAAVLKTTDTILDSEFFVMEDGHNTDKVADNLQTVHFLNTIENLKTGFENERYGIKLVPVRFGCTELFYPLVDSDKRQRYIAKSKPLTETLKRFGKKLGVEVRDPSDLSELQKFLMKEVK